MLKWLNSVKDLVMIVASAIIMLAIFWALFSGFVLLDPSYGYYHPEVIK